MTEPKKSVKRIIALHEEKVSHPIAPIYDGCSRILILGSFPSVKSRECGFYYSHARNRFWRVLAKVTDSDIPDSADGRKAFLLSRHIALWDVIASCTVRGSADVSISDVSANNLESVFSTADIACVFLNGKTAERLYNRFFSHQPVPSVALPSTSPANASFSFEALCEKWAAINRYL